MMVEHGEKAGFIVPEALSLRNALHQDARHLGPTRWRPTRTRPSRSQSEEVYDRYMKYLRGCEHYFTDESSTSAWSRT